MSEASLSFAIIGLGAAGAGTAVEIVNRGHVVSGWWDSDPAIAPAVEFSRGITYEGVIGHGVVDLPRQATNIAGSIAGANIVFVCATADQHVDIARQLRDAAEPEQIFVLHCGYVGGSKVFHDMLDTGRPYEQGRVFELNNTLHLAGRIDPTTLAVRGAKKWLEISGPVGATKISAFSLMMTAFPEFEYTPHVLQSGLNNPNCIGHVPGSIGNAVTLGRELIPASTGVLQFEEARRGRVAALCAALEAERDEITRALGLAPLPTREFTRRAYPAGSRMTGGIARFGPMVQPRYLFEDLPCALVPMESLGAMMGIPTPVITAMITLGEIVAGKEFRSSGRTVETLGRDWVAHQCKAAASNCV